LDAVCTYDRNNRSQSSRRDKHLWESNFPRRCTSAPTASFNSDNGVKNLRPHTVQPAINGTVPSFLRITNCEPPTGINSRPPSTSRAALVSMCRNLRIASHNRSVQTGKEWPLSAKVWHQRAKVRKVEVPKESMSEIKMLRQLIALES